MHETPDTTETYTNGEITRGFPCGCLETQRLHSSQSMLDLGLFVLFRQH